jgi:hypothetical protein
MPLNRRGLLLTALALAGLSAAITRAAQDSLQPTPLLGRSRSFEF